MPDARVPLISRRDEVAPEHQAVFDAIAASRGRVAGPFAVLLHNPEVAKRAAHLGAYLRFESPLAGVDRELAVLATARAMDCRYEWAAHVPLARAAGVRGEAIAAIRARQAPAGLTPTETEIVAYAAGLLGAHRVEAGLFEGLRKRLGAGGMVALTATVGYYAMIACTLNAFDVEPDPGADLLPV
jgi:4-carboxymuconolactone decarboxylase